MGNMDNATKIKALEEMIKEARIQNALFHPTNPPDAWFCTSCSVFGKGRPVCWSCDSTEVKTQWVPRMGGGAQSVVLQPELSV